MERDEYGSSLVELFLALLAIVFMASLIFMPYLTGAVIGLVIYLEVPLAQSIVPGHPFMNYISILFVIEIIIAVLIHIKEIGDAVALCLSEVMVGTISMLLLNAAKPDSIGYCVFLTVAYLIGNRLLLDCLFLSRTGTDHHRLYGFGPKNSSLKKPLRKY